MMGGVPTNHHGQAITHDKEDQAVEGVYAAGECACVSVHGANRLGTNSLLDLIVFGRAIGLDLQHRLAKGLSHQDVKFDEIDKVLERYHRWDREDNTEDFYIIRHQMKKVMSEHFGVFREERKMQEGLKLLAGLQEQLKKAKLADRTTQVFNMARVEALELENMIEVAMATAVGALNRRESRGAHSHYDYPDRDDKQWFKHSLYFKGGKTAYRSVNRAPKDMPAIPLAERE